MKTLLVMSAVLLVLPFTTFATPIPDTGQTKCYDNSQEITCPNPGDPFYGQDAQYGPNLQALTKLDANGNELPDEATEWVMVRDNVTGLIWEVKTDDGTIHDKDTTYNWYNANDVFISSLNSQNFGGYTDWRLPTLKELSFIVDSTVPSPGPTIDTDYFPNTISYAYWSSTTYATTQSYAWFVDFSGGGLNGDGKSSDRNYVRAVRGIQISNNFVDNLDGTVIDMSTGLMWQQDTAPGTYNWQQALSYCESLTLGGYNDWRLPNRNELQSIVDYAQEYPSIDPVFTNTEFSSYLSSTTEAYTQSNTWYVSFFNGLSYGTDKSGSYYLRAVRRCFNDIDCDEILNEEDNCPDVYNPIQEDIDQDGLGDICDNCPSDYNPNQSDIFPPQGNTIGDACECEGNFDCNTTVDGMDAATFKANYGRSIISNPCTNAATCNGDFSCNGNVDGLDAALFKSDFGRSGINNPCPACVSSEPWCQYP